MEKEQHHQIVKEMQKLKLQEYLSSNDDLDYYNNYLSSSHIKDDDKAKSKSITETNKMMNGSHVGDKETSDLVIHDYLKPNFNKQITEKKIHPLVFHITAIVVFLCFIFSMIHNPSSNYIIIAILTYYIIFNIELKFKITKTKSKELEDRSKLLSKNMKKQLSFLFRQKEAILKHNDGYRRWRSSLNHQETNEFIKLYNQIDNIINELIYKHHKKDEKLDIDVFQLDTFHKLYFMKNSIYDQTTQKIEKLFQAIQEYNNMGVKPFNEEKLNDCHNEFMKLNKKLSNYRNKTATSLQPKEKEDFSAIVFNMIKLQRQEIDIWEKLFNAAQKKTQEHLSKRELIKQIENRVSQYVD